MRLLLCLFLILSIACEKLPTTTQQSEFKAAITGFFVPDSNSNFLSISLIKSSPQFIPDTISNENLLQTVITINHQEIDYQIVEKPDHYWSSENEKHLKLNYIFKQNEKYVFEMTGFNGIKTNTNFTMPGEIHVQSKTERTRLLYWNNVQNAAGYFLRGFFLGDNLAEPQYFNFVTDDFEKETQYESFISNDTLFETGKYWVTKNIEMIEASHPDANIKTLIFRVYALSTELVIYFTIKNEYGFEKLIYKYDYSNLNGNCVGIVAGYNFADFDKLKLIFVFIQKRRP